MEASLQLLHFTFKSTFGIACAILLGLDKIQLVIGHSSSETGLPLIQSLLHLLLVEQPLENMAKSLPQFPNRAWHSTSASQVLGVISVPDSCHNKALHTKWLEQKALPTSSEVKSWKWLGGQGWLLLRGVSPQRFTAALGTHSCPQLHLHKAFLRVYTPHHSSLAATLFFIGHLPYLTGLCPSDLTLSSGSWCLNICSFQGYNFTYIIIC